MSEQWISPGKFLEMLTTPTEDSSRLFLLTGDSGAGKTSWCLELVSLARLAGIQPAGLVSPGVYEAGVKTGIDLVDVANGERRRLAVKPGAAPSPQPGIVTQHWRLDPQALAWGSRALERLSTGELLVLDELGPLELLENQGFTAGLALIGERRFRLACAVIRPALLPTAMGRWPWAQAIRPAGLGRGVDA